MEGLGSRPPGAAARQQKTINETRQLSPPDIFDGRFSDFFQKKLKKKSENRQHLKQTNRQRQTGNAYTVFG